MPATTGNVVVDTVEDVGDVTGKFLRIPVVLLQNAALIGIIMLIGFALVASRDMLILSCPFIAQHAVEVAAIIDITISPLYNSVVIIVDVIKAIIDAVKFFEGKHPDEHFIKLKFVPFTAETIRRFFTDLPARCEDYTNIGHTLSEATKVQTNEILCPLVRITYPVPWMWDASNRVFGWGITNAVPQGTFIEDGTDGNCEFRDTPPDWLCIGLSTGYLVVDILLPLLLIAILWPVTVGPVLRLVYREAKMAVSWVVARLAPGKPSQRQP